MKKIIEYIKKIEKTKLYIIGAAVIAVVFSAILILEGLNVFSASNIPVETSSEISEESISVSEEQSSSEEPEVSSEESSSEITVEVTSEPEIVSSEPASTQTYIPKYPVRERVAYLTFDDGPSANTLKVLDILKSNDAVATFFVVGTGNLDYLTEIEQAGCKIGLHCNVHSYKSIYSSVDAYFEDLDTVQNTVTQKVGHSIDIMRFPGGSSNTVSQRGMMAQLVNDVTEKGYTYFDWNVDSSDAKGAAASQIVYNILSQADSCNSICVLMHDELSKVPTVEALPEVIKGLREMGYRFETLSKDSYGYHHAVRN